eukprot:EC692947.1.p1 GENE.EC692947.1~~EC692947.1.p1  ORF type:complete len:256 (+),score=54.28 EC692947.1:96-770(+)
MNYFAGQMALEFQPDYKVWYALATPPGIRSMFGLIFIEEVEGANSWVKTVDSGVKNYKAWNLEKVLEWLIDSDLAQHCDTFEKNQLDGEALSELTKDDLKQMLKGQPFGDTLVLWDKISVLQEGAKAPARPRSASLPAAVPSRGFLQHSEFPHPCQVPSYHLPPVAPASAPAQGTNATQNQGPTVMGTFVKSAAQSAVSHVGSTVGRQVAQELAGDLISSCVIL